MTNSTRLRSAVCIAALLAGGAAHAEVTAAQVWDDWKAQLDLYGEGSVAIGSEEQSGGTVTVTDIVTTMDDGDVRVVTELGDLTFTEQGDGSVAVTMADSYPITMTLETGVVVNILVNQEDTELTVTGDDAIKVYEISAPQTSIALVDVVDGDITFTGDVSLALNDMSGTYTSEAGDLRRMAYDLTVASADMLVDIQIPGEDDEYVVASGKIDTLTMQANIAMPENADMENPEAMFADGFAIDGGYTVGSANYIFDINADGDQAAGSVSTGQSTLTGQMDIQNIAYQSAVDDVAMNFTSQDVPFPIELAMAQYGLGFAMPLGKTEEAADFGLSLNFTDLTINDMIWDMFDGGNVLPRDPATIKFDVSGKAKALFDMLDPEQAEALANSDLPYELENLDLNTLTVSAAGALVTGSGGFTFDNADTTTFDGLPRPEGEAAVEVTGLNGLMDNLVSMGLLPEDQIMGARMMMGMFARTTGDDQLETTLEVNDEGHVLVNGQRMR